MRKIIVGIVPQAKIKTSENPYDDKYEFLDVYTKRIFDAGAIAIGICLNGGKLDYSSLEMCDAFLIPGGNKIEEYCYDIVSYAIKNNKPLIGICMGLQCLAIYSLVTEQLSKDFSKQQFFEKYNELKKINNGSLLSLIQSDEIHNSEITYDTINNARHNIQIEKKSLLYEIYQKDKMSVVSLHNYCPKKIGKDFKISAFASDKVVEAIEYNSERHFILGVLFHAELEDDNSIFKRLIFEANKRIKE